MWLKDLFSGKPKKQEETEIVGLGNALEWLREKTKTGIEAEERQIEAVFSRIREGSARLKEALDSLEKAKLQNEKISRREFALMQGNREFFIRRANLFLGGIRNPNEGDFCVSFNKEFGSFSKSTAKSFYILREFFNNEARNIAFQLKGIEELAKELEGLKEKGKKEKVKKVARLIEEAIQASEHRKRVEKSIGEKKSVLEEREKALKAKTDFLCLFIKGEESRSLSKLKKELEAEKGNFAKLTNELEERFGALMFSMKKYRKFSTEEDVLDRYIESPLRALLGDANLDIVGILEKMGSSIQKGELELKESKKDKITRKIGAINRAYLTDFLENYRKKKSEIEVIEAGINAEPFQKKLEGLESDIAECEKEIEAVKTEICFLEKSLEKSNPGQMLEQINEEIERLTGKRIILNPLQTNLL